MMKNPKDLSQSDVELYNRSRNDVICFASREIAVFLCAISIIFQIPVVLQWICIIIGALFAIFSMIWDSLLTLGKVKKVQGEYLWILFALQGIAVTLFMSVKSKVSLIMVIVLIVHVASFGIAMIMGTKRYEN